MKRKNNRKGFTIVELVIVIAVIGILATVLVPTFGYVIDSAQESKAKQMAKNAYTEYVIANSGVAPPLMVYKHANGKVVAVENGAAANVYDTEAEFFTAYSISVFDMTEGIIYAADGEAGSGDVEDSEKIYRVDPMTYYKEVSYNGGVTWISTNIRENHDNVTEYNYPMINIEILPGSLKKSGWVYTEVEGYYGAVILIEDTIFDQVTIVPNGVKNYAYTFLAGDLKNGEVPAFATGYEETVVDLVWDTKTIEIPDNAKYLYVYSNTGETKYLPSEIIFSKAGAINEGNSFTISTWNIGHFNSGSGMTVEAYRTFIQHQLATDIICLNEYSTNYTGEATVFQNYTAYEGPWRNYSCNAMFYRNLSMTTPTLHEFACNEDQYVPAGTLKESEYYYVTTVVSINGKEVTVVSAHLIFDKTNPNDDQINKDQIKELIDVFETTEGVVLVGDWNCILFDHFDLFKDAGYALANNDPNLETFKGNAVNSKALDNIIYKGVEVKNFTLVETALSDHNALTCTIVVD